MQSASILFWMLVLFVLIIGGFMAVVLVKKWAAKDEGSGENFTLSDLRRLQKTGKISAEEYEKARAAIVAQSQHVKTTSAVPGGRPAGTSDDSLNRQ